MNGGSDDEWEGYTKFWTFGHRKQMFLCGVGEWWNFVWE